MFAFCFLRTSLQITSGYLNSALHITANELPFEFILPKGLGLIDRATKHADVTYQNHGIEEKNMHLKHPG